MVELLFAKKKTPADTLKKVCIVLGVIAVFLISFILLSGINMGIYSLIFLFAAGMAGAALWKYTEVEHEITIVENVMDIDVIYNKTKRKNLYTLDLSKLDTFTDYNESNANRYLNGRTPICLINSGELNDCYIMVVGYGASNINLVIDKKEKLYNYIRKRYPMKLRDCTPCYDENEQYLI